MSSILLILALIITCATAEVGLGYDIITGEVRAPILAATTVETISQPSAQVGLDAEIIDREGDMTDLTSLSVRAQGKLAVVQWLFSASRQFFRRTVTNDRHLVARTSARYTFATYSGQPTVLPFTDAFRAQVELIARFIDANKERAAYEIDRLLLLFGTDVIHSITSGALLVKADVVDTSTLSSSSHQNIKSAALLAFGQYFGIKVAALVREEDMTAYTKSTTTTTVAAYGGQWFGDVMGWLNSTWSSPATVDRHTIPIAELIVPERFTSLAPSIVQVMRSLVIERAEAYADANDLRHTNFTYGGIYQSSTCASLVIMNELTQNTTCPSNFTPFIIERANDTCTSESALCVSQGVPRGFFFGGMYSKQAFNPATGGANCPRGFRALPLGHQNRAIVCSAPFDAPVRPMLEFGGVFTCDQPNFITGHYYCPPDFERHWVGGGDCALYQCTRPINATYKTPGHIEPRFDGEGPAAWDRNILIVALVGICVILVIQTIMLAACVKHKLKRRAVELN